MEMILGELFSLVRNGANIKQYDDASGFPITRIQTISSGFVDRSKVGYANIDDATRYSSYILQDGDILMSHINSLDHLGKAALYQHAEGETLIHGMNLLVLRADTSSLIPKYALRLFQSNKFKASLRKIAKKSVNQASFSVSDLKRLRINVPSLDSQTYVANLFDTIDCIITRAQKLTELLDRLVKSRFIEMFGTVASGTERWETYPLDSMVSIISGYAFKSSKYSEGGTRIIRISNVQDGFIEDKSPAYYSEGDMRGLERYLLREGDLLMSLTGNVGRVGFLQNDLLPAALNQRVACLREKQDTPDGRHVNMRYLYEYFRSDEFQDRAEASSSGVAQKNLSTKWLSALAVALPPIHIQERFADFANQVDKLRFDVQRQVEKLETLKKSLMQEYFG